MTWLITGAAGTIGRQVAADLATSGMPLWLLDQCPVPEVPGGAEGVQADLCDPAVVDDTAGDYF